MGSLGLGPKYSPVIASPSRDILERVGALMVSGKLNIHIDKSFPLEHAR